MSNWFHCAYKSVCYKAKRLLIYVLNRLTDSHRESIVYSNRKGDDCFSLSLFFHIQPIDTLSLSLRTVFHHHWYSHHHFHFFSAALHKNYLFYQLIEQLYNNVFLLIQSYKKFYHENIRFTFLHLHQSKWTVVVSRISLLISLSLL